MLQIGVLGLLQVEVDGALADLGGPRQRAVLLRLLVGQGSSMSVDRLLTDLYEGATAAQRAERPAGVRFPSAPHAGAAPGQADRSHRAAHRAARHALRLPAGALDADAFAADLQVAEQLAGTDPSRVVAHLDAALARWRGEAYAEGAFEPWAVPEAVRLTELRSRAQERRAELALTEQGGAAVVAELEALVREHPLREELAAAGPGAVRRRPPVRRAGRAATGPGGARRRAGPGPRRGPERRQRHDSAFGERIDSVFSAVR